MSDIIDGSTVLHNRDNMNIFCCTEYNAGHSLHFIVPHFGKNKFYVSQLGLAEKMVSMSVSPVLSSHDVARCFYLIFFLIHSIIKG